MLRLSCLARCTAFSAASRLLQQQDPLPHFVESSGVRETHASRLRDSATTHVHRTAEVERLSNTVFGCGNVHLKNVERLTALPEGLHSFPEVCFIGKPNCGKSTLISCLLHNKRLGKAGATPGTTRLLQFFNVGDALLLVDTPGYGGWKGRQLGQHLVERANAFSILFRYLALRKEGNLKRVYWVMESSADTPLSFQARDEELLAFLLRECIPFSVVLTKIDRHWRLHADRQRTTGVVRKDGLLHPSHTAVAAEERSRIPPPEDGVTRNMREVFAFLDCDAVPILAVSANRKQPDRSRYLELLQHDIVHYCTQDLAAGEALTLQNLRSLSYAPPTADRIQDVQLRYPVEAFVVPTDNALSLARMVEQHEAMKAQFLAKNVSAGQLSAKDIAACHLGSTEKVLEISQQEAAQRELLGAVIPSTTFLIESSTQSAAAPSRGGVRHDRDDYEACAKATRAPFSGPLSLWHDPRPIAGSKDGRSDGAAAATRSFHARPQPARAVFQSTREADQLYKALASAIEDESEDDAGRSGDGAEENQSTPRCVALATAYTSSPLPSATEAFGATPSMTPADGECGGNTVALREQLLSSPPIQLPAVIDASTHYVTAIDGTQIPRSMISASVEHLAVSMEDELAHFATMSGAGAYEELLLLDQEGDAAADVFTATSDLARLPETVQTQLEAAKGHRTHSAARKQEARFLAKYVERKRKPRSVYMQAEGYMCPWVGASWRRGSVQGLETAHNLGQSGAVLRGLKQKGFGGKSFSARTLKHRGRATKKTGFWAA